MDPLTSEQEVICKLMGQVAALSKAMMTILVSIPGHSLALEAIKSDLDQLKNRASQSQSDIEYANGFEDVYLELKAGADMLQVVVDVNTAKSSGKIQ